jgi:hypothetical protein
MTWRSEAVVAAHLSQAEYTLTAQHYLVKVKVNRYGVKPNQLMQLNNLHDAEVHGAIKL